MPKQVADGVLVYESEFLQSNAVVVEGVAGALVIDPGIQRSEVEAIARDVAQSGRPVVAGFATHPHWDHVLWQPELGDAPRYGTARCVAAIGEVMADAGWRDRVAEVLPPDLADQIPIDLFGLITGLPSDTDRIPWDGPSVRIIEHQAHAAGHAALLIEEHRVLVAGDMLSDVLIPFLDLNAAEPIDDYVAALRLFEGVADDIDIVIPGHGSVGGADEVRTRIEQDRAYLHALHGGGGADDPRLQPSAMHGAWLPDVHARQLQQVRQREGLA